MRGFLCLIVAVVVPSLAYAHAEDQRETIEVTASASVDREADQVRLTLAVETTARTAEVASDRNAEKMTALIGALRVMGLKKSAIRTLAYRLMPQYDRGERGNRDPDPIGFMAQNMVEARIDSILRAGSDQHLGRPASAKGCFCKGVPRSGYADRSGSDSGDCYCYG